MTDPRPTIALSDPPTVVGVVCTRCSHPSAVTRPICVVCGAAVVARSFRGVGTVFASTVIRIAVGDHIPPYGLAYINLDDGPRLLARIIAGDDTGPIPVGCRVRLTGQSVEGDALFEVAR